MSVTVKFNEVCMSETVSKRLEQLDTGGKIKTIQATPSMASVRKLMTFLEAKGVIQTPVILCKTLTRFIIIEKNDEP